MKRWLVRLSAVSGVVVLGLLAIAQAQRGVQPALAREGPPESDRRATTKPLQRAHRNEAKKPVGPTDPFATRLAQPPTSAEPELPPPQQSSGTAPHADPLAVADEYLVGEDDFPAADEAPQAGPADMEGGFDGQLAAAGDEPAGRYAPGSIRPEAAPAAGRRRAKKPARAKSQPKVAPAQDAPAAADPVEVDRYGRPLAETATPREPEPLELEPARSTSSQFAEPPARIPDLARPAADPPVGDGTGRPGGKQLEGPQTPSLTLEKLAPAEVQVGKPATFQIRVRNTGTATASAVEIRDVVPQGMQLLSTNPRASSGAPGEVVWPLGTLEPGEEATVELELMPVAEGELGSVAAVRFASEVSVRTTATRPQLVIEVSAPREVMIGDDVTLSIKISNPGTGAATGVVLSESIPDNLEHPAGADLEYEIGDLEPNETRELDLTMKAARPGTVTNVLSARGEGQVQAQAQTELEVVAPALEVTLDGPKRRYLERQATYTVLVSNPGTAPANQVELVTHLPKGLKFVEATNSGQYDPETNSVHWLLEELPANETGTVTLTTLPIEAGEQTLRVEGTAQRGLSAEKEEVVLIEGVAAILFQVADIADPIEVGGETTYEIRVVNQGSKAATNVRLVAFLPAEMKPVAAEGPTRHEFDGQEVRFLELPRLAPKADTTYRLRVQGLEPGDMRIRVQIMTDEIRTPVTKEESTRVYADE